MPLMRSATRGSSRSFPSSASSGAALACSRNWTSAVATRSSGREAGAPIMRAPSGPVMPASIAIAQGAASSLGSAVGRPPGYAQDDPQTGRVVLEPHGPTMQARDRLHKAQTEAGAGLGAALLQAHETLQDALAIACRNAGAVVGDRDLNSVLVRMQLDRNGGVLGLRRILDGVVDEVGDRLPHELAVCREAAALGNVEGKLQPTLLRDRLVELGEVAYELARIELLGVLLQHAGFEAGNQQKRVEGLDELVRFLDRMLEALAVGVRPARVHECGL